MATKKLSQTTATDGQSNSMNVCVCVCVCGREIEREWSGEGGERESERNTKRDRYKMCAFVCMEKRERVLKK